MRLKSILFSVLHIENAYRICKSLDFDSIRFDAVDSIEISMYRPNFNPILEKVQVQLNPHSIHLYGRGTSTDNKKLSRVYFVFSDKFEMTLNS